MAPGYFELWRESRQMQAKVETAPPKGEWSLTDPILYPKGSKPWPYNPDIFASRKGGMKLYDKMRRDSMVKACQWIKRLAVLCSGWDVEPASDTEGADQEAADFVKEVLTELKGTLEETIKQILSGMDYGYSVSEKIWWIIPEGDFKGKWGYKAVKTRKPHDWQFDIDEYGNLKPQGLWQLNGVYKYDPDKFVVYSHNGEFQNWYGTSDLQAVYPHWWSKDVIMRFWNNYLEKFGMGIPYLRPGEGKSNIPEPVYTELKNALFNLQATSAIATQTADAMIEILESKRRGKDDYLGAIQYHDRAVARGLLMPTGLGFTEDEAKGGSFARSKKHFDMWLSVINDLRGTGEETIMQEQLVRPLVDFNYSVKKYPRFRFNPFEDEETEGLGRLWLEALSGKAVHPTPEDENHFRKMIRFPEREEQDLQDEFDEDREAKDAARERLRTMPQPEGDELPPKPGEEKSKVIPFQPKEHARTWHRELTPYEKRVDFAAVEKALDDLEAETRGRLVKILGKQRDNLVETVERAGDKVTINWINSRGLKYLVEARAIIREFLRSAFELGRADVRAEVQRAKGGTYQSPPFTKMSPRQAVIYLDKKAFWITNVFSDRLLAEVKGLLINMLETGEVPGETLQKIRDVYEPYVGSSKVIADADQVEPWRIETLIRTNATSAYNGGKDHEIFDPDLADFVLGVQLSNILDIRTTRICHRADDVTIRKEDPLFHRLRPSLHYNCRTVRITITAADKDVTWSPQSELHAVLSLMPPGFGGNLDRG